MSARDHRRDARFHEVDVLYRLVGVFHHMPEGEIDRFQARSKECDILGDKASSSRLPHAYMALPRTGQSGVSPDRREARRRVGQSDAVELAQGTCWQHQTGARPKTIEVEAQFCIQLIG